MPRVYDQEEGESSGDEQGESSDKEILVKLNRPMQGNLS